MALSKISILLCATAFFWSSVSAMGPIQSQVRQLEQESEIDQSTLYTNITYRPVRRILESECSSISMQKAQAIAASASKLVDARYSQDGAYLLTDTQQVYTLITKLQNNLRTFDDDRYCTVKYVLNAIQLRMREIHLGFMEDTGLIDEFDGVNEFDPNVKGFEAKRGILDLHIRTYANALGRLGAVVEPSVLNPEFLNTLSPQQEILLQKAQELMQVMVAQTMLDLKERKLISQQEINDLASKIQFEYVAACGIFNGKYELKQVFRGDTLVSQAPNSLTLKINLCPSYFVIRDLTDIYRKIITHELGHHIYYFTDPKSEEFTSVCWTGEKNRTSSCSNDDFVTTYAQTSGLEDYAEHFMHRFIGETIGTSPVLQQKSLHFDTLESSL